MRIRYTPQAKSDLDNIADYIASRNPRAAIVVIGDILDTVDRIAIFPMAGKAQMRNATRRIVSPAYGYLIYYEISPEDPGALNILRIIHGRQRRPYEDT